MLGIDLTGLPETERGNKYLFTCTDYFTKWVEAFPIKDKSAQSIAKCLIKVFCRHGAPERVLSDRGREFVNEVSIFPLQYSKDILIRYADIVLTIGHLTQQYHNSLQAYNKNIVEYRHLLTYGDMN